MSSSTIPDNDRIIVLRCVEGTYIAFVRQGEWYTWQGGFLSIPAALAWAMMQNLVEEAV